jgi:hypothetical protein
MISRSFLSIPLGQELDHAGAGAKGSISFRAAYPPAATIVFPFSQPFEAF